MPASQRAAGICLLIFLLLICHGYSNAQEDFRAGFIVTSRQDTISGFINTSVTLIKDGVCAFKRETSGTVENFDPSQLFCFGYPQEDQVFSSLHIPPRGNVFAELLLRGRADLYYYDGFFYLRKDGVTEKIEKEQTRESNIDGGRYVFSHKTYIGTLNRYFADCLPPRLLRGELGYKEKDFVAIFRQYAECSGVAYHIYKAPPQARKLIFHILAGVNSSIVSFPEKDLDIFKPDVGFFFGGGLSVPLRQISDKLFISAEVFYHENTYTGSREGFTAGGPVQKDYAMKVSTIKFPVGLRLNLSRRSTAPYIRGGMTPFLPLKSSWTIAYNGTTEQQYQFKEKTASLVYWGSFGIERKIRSNNSVFAELRLEKIGDYIGFYGPNGATNIPSSVLNRMLVVGVHF